MLNSDSNCETDLLDEMPSDTTTTTKSEIIKLFELDDEALKTIKCEIGKELELGLRDEEAASIKMLITYVREMSRGDETGSYLALDLGGTNFRVLLVELNEGQAKATTVVHVIPHQLLITQNGQDLFDFIALKLLEFVKQHKLNKRRISLGFTFSFPCKQYGLTQSVLVKWCKGFQVGGVVGTDVVKQLKDALKRQLAGLVEAYIDVVAVINDTTGTLVACANSSHECCIGLIVGTGFNACYMEQLDKCEKWPANYTNPKQVIINCEWGAMGDSKERRQLDKFRNEFDHEVDVRSVNPANQMYEKMVSGMYIGELLRLTMLKLYKNKQLFVKMATTDSSLNGGGSQRKSRSKSSRTSPPSQSSLSPTSQPQHKLFVRDVLNGRHFSLLAKDELSGNYEEATKMMKELNITHYEEADLQTVIALSSAIIHRSAHLVASGISSLLERLKRPYSVIGYDGSVIKHHPYFLKKLNEKCLALTPKKYRFNFMLSSDGSGIGAAVVAAALHKERSPLYVVKGTKLYEMHFPIKSQMSQSG